MTPTAVHQQFHGYRKGHQLLSASLVLNARDQDAVDSLSDLTGRLRPGQVFDPYLTAYPLPSRSHYVLARTFQDLDAPRSGCVLTRSLFVPMNTWVELNNVEGLLAMLVSFQEGEEARPHYKPAYSRTRPDRVSDERLAELVQALFLDDVRPVVVFDAPQADLIATRLLLALWPGLRRGFSICTLALGPRRLGDRDFDLLFAPLTAQSLFSKESFCRIGARGSVASDKFHRLAALTAEQVFRSEEPTLVPKDVLALMAEDELCDRLVVRTLLRWNELALRADTKPTAVLGMLDILNSRGGPSSQAWDRLSPMVYRALDLAVDLSSQRESWDFLFAFIAKVEWNTAPAGLERELERAARLLARDTPEEALGAVESLSTDVGGSAAVLKGLGDGVAESRPFEALSKSLSQLAPNALLRLVDVSDRLGEALIAAMNAAASRWLDTVVRVLDGEDAGARRRVRKRLVSLVEDAVAMDTVPSMLLDVGGLELADIVVELGRRGRFRSDVFNAVLAEATRKSGSVDVVRDTVFSHVQSGDVVAFLLKILEFTDSDLEWLLGLSDRVVAGRLLTALLAHAETIDIQSKLANRARAPRVVSVLCAVLPTSASEIARVLTLGLMRNGSGLDVGFDVVSMLPARERPSLERWLLRELLSAAPLGDARVGRALDEFQSEVTAEELIVAATATSIHRSRVSENLLALNAAPQNLRNAVVGVIDVLTGRLVERHREELDEAAYGAWADMLADAGAINPERQLKTAATVFAFALQHLQYPVSTLVVVAFPNVFRNLAKLKALGGVSIDLFGVSYYSWVSWKKRKYGRRELINALVRAFLRSSWPPADLIVAALKADAVDRVVKRLDTQILGTQYVKLIAKDAERLENGLGRRVLACIADKI